MCKKTQDWRWERYEDEIFFQAKLAEIAWQELSEARAKGDDVRTWHAIHSMLSAVACISKILWPPSSKKGDQEARAARGEQLRERLGVADCSPLKSRAIRDHFEHFDERLDEWVSKGMSVYSDRNIVRRDVPMSVITSYESEGKQVVVPDFRRFWEPATVSFSGDKIDLGEILKAVRQLRDRISADRQSRTA